jgi:membrane protease YdiL (CAAX protease family)
MVLGYVYQRTHRLLPSIVCHALFNAFSLYVLWLALTAGAPAD